MEFDSRAGIDLHVHSTASDGTLTPSELIQMALNLGLSAIAITDHDTLAGSVSAMADGVPAKLNLLSGVEISAAAPDGFGLRGSIHILGYGFDLGDSALNSLLEVLQNARENRNPRILARLSALGMDLNENELAHIVGNASAGRPHIAQLMVQKGMANSIEDAFHRFLSKNKPGYVGKFRVPLEEAIGVINNAGGVAVLAHPYVNGLNDPQKFETFLLILKSMGLKGIEAIYPDHPQAAVAEYCRLARKHRLLITGGTDFHGDVTPGIQMGVGDGCLHVPHSIYEHLAAYLER